jgi:hypothetical protein
LDRHIGRVSKIATEEELVDATQRLENAAREMQKQNEILRAQNRALEGLKKWQRGIGENQATDRRKRRDRWAREKGLVGLVVCLYQPFLSSHCLTRL